MDVLETLTEFLRTRYPQFATEKIEPIDTGWSNRVLVVGERYVFRFPRSEAARITLQMEQRLLPELKKVVRIAIPDFIYQSEPADDIKYVGYSLIKGNPITKTQVKSLSGQERKELSRDLAEFLTALHSIAPETVFSAKHHFDLKHSWEGYYNRIQMMAFPHMDIRAIAWTNQQFEGFLANLEPFPFQSCLIHSDLKSQHIIYDFENRRLAGVIDFGAIKVGDPAHEFSKIYNAYGEKFAREVLKYYQGTVDETFDARIKGFYLKIRHFSGILHGIKTGDQQMTEWYLNRLQNIIRQDWPNKREVT